MISAVSFINDFSRSSTHFERSGQVDLFNIGGYLKDLWTLTFGHRPIISITYIDKQVAIGISE
jgi:hypothetical protein